MIDEKFMNQIIETLNMRACEEMEQYAGQAIETVDSGIFIALERWLRLKEDFLSADISPKVIEPISPRGENGTEAQTMEYHPNPKDGVRNIENAEKDSAKIVKLLFDEREAWEAKTKEALKKLDDFLRLLAAKDEVQK